MSPSHAPALVYKCPRGWVWLCCLLLWPLLGMAQDGGGKVGFVDMQRLIEEAPQMRDWRDRLQREFSARNRELAVEAGSIDELKRRRDSEGALLSSAELERLSRQIEAAERALRRSRSELSSLESVRKNEALDAISKRIGEAAASAARARGFDVVLTRENAVFIDPALDLTAPVLEQLRKDAASQ